MKKKKFKSGHNQNFKGFYCNKNNNLTHQQQADIGEGPVVRNWTCQEGIPGVVDPSCNTVHDLRLLGCESGQRR